MSDLAWEALKSAAMQVAPDLSLSFLEKIYSIEKKYQFEQDSEVLIREMQKLIEAEIDEISQGDKHA
jgi:hypothetical protein